MRRRRGGCVETIGRDGGRGRVVFIRDVDGSEERLVVANSY
jgi:hypothetical protein